MSPDLRRHIMLAALVVLTLLATCTGCAVTYPGYAWRHDPTMPACHETVWKQVDRYRMTGLCSRSGGRADACTTGCVVFSWMSEDEARHAPTVDFGVSLYDHEMMHAKGQMRHD